MFFLKKQTPDLKSQRLETQMERSESAFHNALEAERRGDEKAAKRFIQIAVEQEAKAF